MNSIGRFINEADEAGASGDAKERRPVVRTDGVPRCGTRVGAMNPGSGRPRRKARGLWSAVTCHRFPAGDSSPVWSLDIFAIAGSAGDKAPDGLRRQVGARQRFTESPPSTGGALRRAGLAFRFMGRASVFAGWLVLAAVFFGLVSSLGAQEAPRIEAGPTNQSVVLGEGVVFQVQAAGAGPLSFQWRKDGVAIADAVGTELTLSQVLATDAGAYSVVVTNEGGSVTSADAVLSVLLPPTIVVPPANQTFTEWTSAKLSVNAIGTPPLTYQWSKGGVALPDGTSNDYVIPMVQPFHAGEWSVVVANSHGAVTSSVALVRVQRRTEAGGQTLLGWGYRAFVMPCGFGGPVSKISGGGSHSLAVRTDGRLIAWGNDIDGQCAVPLTLSNVVAAVGGQQFSLALDGAGRVVAWGRSTFGELNLPSGLSDTVAIAAGWYHALALRADGTILAWGNNFSGQASVPSGVSNLVAVAAGREHSVALSRDGTVFAWGGNGSGQTSVPSGLAGIAAIAAGESFSAALSSNGTVTVWGQGTFGQTNPPAGLANVSQIASGTYHVLALKSDGTVVAWGDNTYRQSTVPEGLSNVVAVAAGSYHSLALRGDGTVVAWGGINRTGEATAPSELENIVAVDVGNEDVLVLRRDATVLSFGYGFVQQQPVPAGLSDVTAISAGTYHNLALRQDGMVTAWGSTGGKTNVPSGLNDAVSVSGGTDHSVALRRDGAVVVWGSGALGQTNVPSGLGPALAIAAGENHTLAIRADGSVAEWGLADSERSGVPSGLTGVVGLAAGDSQSLALRADGSLFAWGGGPDGITNVPAGVGDVVQVAAGGRHNLALRRDGSVVAWGSPFQGATNVPPNLSNVVAIAAGPGRSVALVGRGAPLILRQTPSQIVVSNASVTFSVEVAGLSPVQYQWFKDGDAVAGATNELLSLSSAQLADAGVYRVAISNAAGFVTSDGARLTVQMPPTIETQPGDQTVPLGASFSLAVAVSGTAPMAHQWFRNGQLLLRANTPTYALVSARPADAGEYVVVTTNASGSVTSRVAAVTVTIPLDPPVIVQQPRSQTNAPGTDATLAVEVLGSSPMTFQWYVGLSGDRTGPIAEATNATLTTPVLTATTSYWVAIANAAGSTNSETATVTIESVDPVGLSWAALSAISYGAALSGSQLNATARVPGAFVYSPGAGTILPAGTHTLYVSFTPADHSLAATNGSVQLVVLPASLTVQVLDETNVLCAPLPPFRVSYTGLVGTDTPASLALPMALSTTATNCSPVADYPIACAAPATWRNYAVTCLPGTLHQVTNDVTGLVMEAAPAALNAGEVVVLRLSGTNSLGDSLDLTRAANWQASDPAVLDARPSGFVVGLTAGAGEIRADYQGQTTSVAIAVQPVPGRLVVKTVGVTPTGSQLGSCACLASYQSATEITGATGVIRQVSVVLLDITGSLAARLEHDSGSVSTSSALLKIDRLSGGPMHRWDVRTPPVSLALREDAGERLDRYTAPAPGVYRPDADAVTGDTMLTARGPSANGTWTLRGVAPASAGLPGGWILVVDTDTNTPPSVASIANVTMPAGAAGYPVFLDVSDDETPLFRLRVQAAFDRPGLQAGQAFWFTRDSRGGPVLHLRPERFPSGPVRATVSVLDDLGAQAQVEFDVTVSADRMMGSYTNEAAIQIPAWGKAELYPSPIEVSGVAGRVVQARVTLRGVQHSWPDDLNFLLVAPDGRKVMLLSDAGGGTPAAGVDLTFSADGLVSPADGTGPYPGLQSARGVCQGSARWMVPDGLRRGIFRPVNYGDVDEFPEPAPAGPVRFNLESLLGAEPNGTWSLYVVDDTPGNDGAVAGGWSIELVTSSDPGLLAGGGFVPDNSQPDGPLIREWQTGDATVRLISVMELPTGEALLEIAGRAGTRYSIERSTNGVDWGFVGAGLIGDERFSLLIADHQEMGRPTYRVIAGASTAGMQSRPSRVVEFTHFPDGTSCLRIEATPGHLSRLQGTVDFERWDDVQWFVPSDERVELLDFSDEPFRFYRLAEP